MTSATPFLWFDGNAVEAAEFYVSVFPGARIVSKDGMSATFELFGREYIAFNGGAYYQLTPAFSMMVDCPTQDDIDALWTKLLAGGGQESRCGWLVDRFGLSWQVAPRQVLAETIGNPDPAKAQKAVAAMMTMAKFDIAGLRAAVQ
jgi:predicted 3-demethylubiquinone-9 3-methyltransferase (glyoxalase superfamily)